MLRCFFPGRSEAERSYLPVPSKLLATTSSATGNFPQQVRTGTKSRIFLSLGAGVTPAAGAGCAAPLLIEPLAVVPAEDFGGVSVADGLRRGMTGFVLGFACDVVFEFLVSDLADRVAVF